MLKNIINIPTKDLTDLLSSKFEVIEKLDMHYFRLNITKAGIFVTKNSTDKVISDIDCIINPMLSNVIKYSDLYEKIRDQILEIYGECRIGIFYNSFPRTKHGKIEYTSCTNKNGWGHRAEIDVFDNEYRGTFIFSDLYTSVKSLNNQKNFDRFIKSINDAGILLFPRPVIYINEGLKGGKLNKALRIIDKINEANEYNRKPLYSSLAFNLINKSLEYSYDHTYSKDINCCEAVIIKNEKIQCEIPLNPVKDVTEEERNAKRMYRDIVLTSFASEMMKNKDLLEKLTNSTDSYVEKVSDLFIKYIETTDLFSKYKIEDTDLLPPGSELLGRVTYDSIPNNTAVTLCKFSPVYENIFRLLLHSLSKKISDNKFSELPDNISNYLNELIIALKYKNYKEIAYELYKTQN